MSRSLSPRYLRLSEQHSGSGVKGNPRRVGDPVRTCGRCPAPTLAPRGRKRVFDGATPSSPALLPREARGRREPEGFKINELCFACERNESGLRHSSRFICAQLDDPEPEENDDSVASMRDDRPMGAVCDEVFGECDKDWSQGSVVWRGSRMDSVESPVAASLRQSRAVQVGHAPARRPEAILIRNARRERVGQRPLLCRASVVWLAGGLPDAGCGHVLWRGAVGDASVTDLGPCPKIQIGTGTVVTGTFRHQSDENTNVVNLKLDDQIELTGVTSNHSYPRGL